jgi:glutathione S-transferase
MALTLVTIPFSHFCEKARWSLDAAGVSYREEGHVPALHRRAVRRPQGRTSVPILVLDDGSVLGDSPIIVRFADAQAPDHRKLLPSDGTARDEALSLEHRFDVDLAPHIRRFAYFHLLPSRALTLRVFERRTPRFEQVVAGALFPALRGLMRRFMSIDQPHALESRDRIRRVFDDVGARIADRRYLLGDRFGALDITFAAFAAPMLMPSEHPVVPDGLLELFPPAFVEEVAALRETPAGRFALRLYRDHRRDSPVAAH